VTTEEEFYAALSSIMVKQIKVRKDSSFTGSISLEIHFHKGNPSQKMTILTKESYNHAEKTG
jgi:hypothetical protein